MNPPFLLQRPKLASGWKGWLFEHFLGLVSSGDRGKEIPDNPHSIFVLRNNDLGDVLVSTPLLRALAERFPSAKISVGVGDWARPILENNPYVHEVLPVNAPWANKFVANHSLAAAVRYLLWSKEVSAVKHRKFGVGIDIFGFALSMAFLLRSGIPYRIGVAGAHGGWSAAHWALPFNGREHVSAANLRIAQYLKDGPLPEAKPELFLTPEESRRGEEIWSQKVGAGQGKFRIALGPASGERAKNWPEAHFEELIERLERVEGVSCVLLGGVRDQPLCQRLINRAPSACTLAGELDLRGTFAVVAACDLMVCNSTMLLHAAAAFRRRIVLVLGANVSSVGAEHERLWGYPDLGRTFTGEPGESVASVAEVFQAVHEELTSASANRHEAALS